MEKIKLIPWTKALDRKLCERFDNMTSLRHAVHFGGAEIYEIEEELIVIVRPELMADGQGWELVWLISFGSNLNKHIPTMLKRARKNNFKAIRYHCDETEKAVIRLVGRHGATRCETVYRLDLQELE